MLDGAGEALAERIECRPRNDGFDQREDLTLLEAHVRGQTLSQLVL